MIGSLTKIEEKALREFKTELMRRYPKRVKKVILYGSKARGEAAPDSDIDVLILADRKDLGFENRISDLLYPIIEKYRYTLVITKMLYDYDQFQADRDHLFVKNVLREGIEI